VNHFSRISRRWPWLLLLLAAVMALPPASSGRGAPAAQTLIYVALPGVERAAFLDPDGVLERRFADALARTGWFLEGETLSDAESTGLDAWRDAVGDGLLLLAPEYPDRTLYLGPDPGGVAIQTRGEGQAEPLSRLAEESRIWLDRADRLRWEEVVECLDLTTEENLAFRNLALDEDPLGAVAPSRSDGAQLQTPAALARLKQAFLRDKRVANLALYLGRTRRPAATGLRLDLAAAHGELAAALEVQGSRAEADLVGSELPTDARGLPSLRAAAPELREAADQARFRARVIQSGARIAGRCDRVLQSLLAEAETGTWLVVDARAGAQPFVAVARKGSALGSPETRSGLLSGLLSELLSELLRDPQRSRVSRSSAVPSGVTARTK